VIPAAADIPARKKRVVGRNVLGVFPRCQEFSSVLFNLSPAGHWNIYRFEDYRQGMQEEMAFVTPFSVHNQWTLYARLELNWIKSSRQTKS